MKASVFGQMLFIFLFHSAALYRLFSNKQTDNADNADTEHVIVKLVFVHVRNLAELKTQHMQTHPARL